MLFVWYQQFPACIYSLLQVLVQRLLLPVPYILLQRAQKDMAGAFRICLALHNTENPAAKWCQTCPLYSFKLCFIRSYECGIGTNFLPVISSYAWTYLLDVSCFTSSGVFGIVPSPLNPPSASHNLTYSLSIFRCSFPCSNNSL